MKYITSITGMSSDKSSIGKRVTLHKIEEDGTELPLEIKYYDFQDSPLTMWVPEADEVVEDTLLESYLDTAFEDAYETLKCVKTLMGKKLINVNVAPAGVKIIKDNEY